MQRSPLLLSAELITNVIFFVSANVTIMTSGTVLFIVAVLAIAVSAQDSCNQWTTCGVCTGQGSCGWCTYSGTCESGNQTGSFVGCTTPYWVWTSGFCPATPAPSTPAPVNTCGTASSCTSCTALGSCGWCSFNNQCEQGNSTGSFQGCVSPYWSWTNNQCSTPAPPANFCSDYNGAGNCNVCTQIGGCGFCLSTLLCEAGTNSGSYSGDCSGVNWAWSTLQCEATPAPTVPNTCGNYNGNCALCTGQGSCGYCLSSNLCEAGTGSGSNAGDCSGVSWAWTSSQCTAVPTPVPAVTPAPQSVCGDYMNDCIGCTEQGSCGYCASTNQCEAGTATGSNAGDCSGTNWVWYNSQCNSTAQ